MGDIEKANIKNLDTNDSGIDVMFNPKEYILDKPTVWREDASVGTNLPAATFVNGQRRTLYMELFYDTTINSDGQHLNTDVSVETKKLEDLMIATDHDGVFRPPILLFSWGSFKFTCVLEDLVQKFTKFDAEGNPLRAIVRVVFKEMDGGGGKPTGK